MINYLKPIEGEVPGSGLPAEQLKNPYKTGKNAIFVNHKFKGT